MLARSWGGRALVFITLLAAGIKHHTVAAPLSNAPVIGIATNTPHVFALTGARIVSEPGRVIEKGVVVVRDGVIIAVGADVKPPADARVIDLEGRTIYPGFIDAFSELAVDAEVLKQGAADWNPQIAPQIDLANHFAADEPLNGKLRSQGITARLVAPATRIIKGQSIVVSTGETENARAILKTGVAQHFRLTIAFGQGRDNYPNSPMGAVALARQSLLDAEWYGQALTAAENQPALPRPDRNDALEALRDCATGKQLAIIDAANEQFFLRADRFSREFGLRTVIRGSGREYRRLAEVAAAGRSVIVPVNFPQPPAASTVEDALDATLVDLMHWDLAPENAGRLDAAGVQIALTSHGLRDVATFLAAVRKAVERGLKPERALAALTTNPAQIVGLGERLGKIAPGMAANLAITDGDLFARSTKVVETWVAGRRFEIEQPPVIDVRGTWELESAGSDGRALRLGLKIAGTGRQLSGTLTKPASEGAKSEEIRVSPIAVRDGQLTFRFEGKALGKPGPARASATVVGGDDKLTLLGTSLWADGTSERLTGSRQAKLSADELKRAAQDRGKKAKGEEATERAKDGGAEGAGESPAAKALYDVNYPLGDFGRFALPEQAKLVAISNATLWTCGPQGIVERGTLLIGGGKIIAVGKDVEIPAEAMVVDAKGAAVSPGIIDCHSHIATDGGVNESAQAITAEVRIGDFIDADDISIYRQLAGGVTTANVLHGSANPIGGQNQVIKLRWGASGEDLKFASAPGGIKFALGENVKQSNLEARLATRYPQSRMGVEQIIRDAFGGARDYQQSWDRWNRRHEGLPPRRDLELETLSEILQKQRWVHCHSYRQDEILALIRIFDDFGITIGTLQHVLEGYKVADAIAKHGGTGSTFSDWWAYKFEVFDAIPFNGALMQRQKVIVSFNSDDDELARHLNHEAAKAIKYGGVPREEALKFVTLNPAKQLRIEAWVGSLETGKDADFVLWSGDPLAVTSRCEQTWIDGRKFFDREGDRKLRSEQAQMRAALMRRVLESGQTPQTAEQRESEEWELWPRHDEACHDELHFDHGFHHDHRHHEHE